jgi:hypothetical protein
MEENLEADKEDYDEVELRIMKNVHQALQLQVEGLHKQVQKERARLAEELKTFTQKYVCT